MRILLIEDDSLVCSFIEKSMGEAGHSIDIANDGEHGLQMALASHYDVLILDRMLPKLDGLSLVKTLKDRGHITPVLILSALGDVDNRILGLKSGGDDYLVKPFVFEELLARLEVLARRNISKTNQTLSVADLQIDLITRKVTRAGKDIDVQSREFKLLEYLVRNKGQLVTRMMLLEAVWDYHFDPQTNVIDVHISRLRSKIDKDFATPIIRTVRGSGYIIEAT
jgi:two-component system, OmpR family, response regulator